MSNKSDYGVLVNVLRRGVAFCGYMITSLSYQLFVYTNYHGFLPWDANTPLILASCLGHVSVARCLLKQRKTACGAENFQKFMWTSNRANDTAFDVAVRRGRIEVAKLLLENVSLQDLISKRNHEGKHLVFKLCNPKHDNFILDTFDKATKAVMHPGAIRIHEEDLQRESPQVYTDSIMGRESYPQSHVNETRTSLLKLDQGEVELTPNKNTILHLVSHIGDIKYASEILVKHPSLLYHCNSEGETPAYIAAREGHVDVLAIIIKYFRTNNDDIESLVTRRDNHSALHIAIQNHHVGIVFWLIKEVPQLANLVNNFSESPIYLAAERRYYHLLNHMLTNCEAKSFEGPQGKTALHAAAISGSKECITYLLREEIDQKVQDEHGWTPLRYVVHHNNAKAAAELVAADPSIVNEIMKEDGINTFVVHIAASRGYREVLEALMSECPGCTELVDEKGKSILHVAVKNKKTDVIELLYRHGSYTSLVNKKDYEGNTPIHLLMDSDLEIIDLVMDSRANINTLNNEKRTPLDMASNALKNEKRTPLDMASNSLKNEKRTPLDMPSSDDKRKRLLQGIAMGRKVNKKERARADSKFMENFLVVATLIATASFAAAFTVPGGFNGNEGSKQGMPILLRKLAFQAFMISDTIAFSCSVAVLLLRVTLFLREGKNGTYDPAASESPIMYLFVLIAMYSMMAAFATGIYVVLTPYLGLAIFLCTLTIAVPLYGLGLIAILYTSELRKKRLKI